jgi:hypothetical protein
VSAGGASAAASAAACSSACCQPPPASTFERASTLRMQLQCRHSPVPWYAMPCLCREATYTRILKLEPSPPCHLSGEAVHAPSPATAQSRSPCPASTCDWAALRTTPDGPLPCALCSASMLHTCLPRCCLQTRRATLSSRRCARTPPSAPQCTCCCATPGCAPTRWDSGGVCAQLYSRYVGLTDSRSMHARSCA